MSALWLLAGIVAVVVIVLLNAVVVMWCERKWLGHLQSRLGPMRTGFHGLLQPVADAVKLLGKEDLVPSGADRVLFLVAPLIAFVPALLVYAALPWSGDWLAGGSDVGIFLVFGVAALFPVGILVAGWSSRNKYSLIGGFRAAAQQISYEVPMILAVLGVVMLANTMSMRGIVEAQSGGWFILTQPFAFAIYFIAMLAELNRIPFDLPEAESELVAGFNTEYSGMRFALFFLAEYINVFTWSLITVLLFFGGWSGPLLPGWAWLGIKTYGVVFLIIWMRGTFPRVRVDQLMALGWKVLLPASIASVAVTAAGLFTKAWLLAFMQLALLGGLVVLMGRLGSLAGNAARTPGAGIEPLRRGRHAASPVGNAETEGAA